MLAVRAVTLLAALQTASSFGDYDVSSLLESHYEFRSLSESSSGTGSGASGSGDQGSGDSTSGDITSGDDASGDIASGDDATSGDAGSGFTSGESGSGFTSGDYASDTPNMPPSMPPSMPPTWPSPEGPPSNPPPMSPGPMSPPTPPMSPPGPPTSPAPMSPPSPFPPPMPTASIVVSVDLVGLDLTDFDAVSKLLTKIQDEYKGVATSAVTVTVVNKKISSTFSMEVPTGNQDDLEWFVAALEKALKEQGASVPVGSTATAIYEAAAERLRRRLDGSKIAVTSLLPMEDANDFTMASGVSAALTAASTDPADTLFTKLDTQCAAGTPPVTVAVTGSTKQPDAVTVITTITVSAVDEADLKAATDTATAAVPAASKLETVVQAAYPGQTITATQTMDVVVSNVAPSPPAAPLAVDDPPSPPSAPLIDLTDLVNAVGMGIGIIIGIIVGVLVGISLLICVCCWFCAKQKAGGKNSFDKTATQTV